jgi:tRNA-(ms[2]io[6]A)-hydroxylase
MLCLKNRTDATWATIALEDVNAILVDHAHCEMKAASNALSLAARNPDDTELVLGLTSLAREEIDHFQRIVGVLASRGIRQRPPGPDGYAVELRRAAERLPKTALSRLVDRLLVGAMIEARSCERFSVLADAASVESLTELRCLWRDLMASEARHYRTFVDLAVRANGGDRASTMARLEVLAQAESDIVMALSHRARCDRTTIHG